LLAHYGWSADLLLRRRITIVIPAAYFVCGIALIGLFVVLSKPTSRQVRGSLSHDLSDRGHVRFAWLLLAAPEIG